MTRLARQAAGAAHAYVVLVEEDHVWQSGFDDMPESIGALTDSTTAKNIDDFQPIWMENIGLTWSDHPWVSGPPHARAYANVPVSLGALGAVW